MAERPTHIDREDTHVTNVTGFGMTASRGACSGVGRRLCPDGSAGSRGSHPTEIVGATCE
jgi:hypothetical protein